MSHTDIIPLKQHSFQTALNATPHPHALQALCLQRAANHNKASLKGRETN